MSKKGKDDIEKLKAERDDYLEGWKRAKADYINYKSQEKARIQVARKRIKKELIMEILPVIDNFALAAKMIPKAKKEDDSIKGLLGIKAQLNKFLKDQGVEEIEAIGKEFNPNLHEALEMVEKEEEESGKIVEEIQKGYLLDGEVLRPSRVKVIK